MSYDGMSSRDWESREEMRERLERANRLREGAVRQLPCMQPSAQRADATRVLTPAEDRMMHMIINLAYLEGQALDVLSAGNVEHRTGRKA